MMSLTARLRLAQRTGFARLRLNQSPPWLVSLVVHLLVIILLGLWQVTARGAPGKPGIDVTLGQFADSGGSLEGALAEQELAVVESPTSADQVASLQPLEQALVSQPALEFSSPAPSEALAALAASSGGKGTKGEGSGLGGSGNGSGAGNGDGEATQTSVFGLAAEGNKFCYVMDRSESMGSVYYSSEDPRQFGVPLEAAKSELMASISELTRQQQFYLVYYNHQARTYQARQVGRPIFASTDNKNRAMEFIYKITPEGGTNHLDALQIAIRLRPDVIFLLTDGEEKDDPTLADLKHLERVNGGIASINIIQFGEQYRPDSSLIQLAHENRGQHVFVNIARANQQARSVGERLRKWVGGQLQK